MCDQESVQSRELASCCLRSPGPGLEGGFTQAEAEQPLLGDGSGDEKN